MSVMRRANALAEFEILDSPPEQEFDDLTHLASQICGTPVSLISLLDSGRQWFKSTVGVELKETPIEFSFCTHAVDAGELLEVPDLSRDARFKENPFVVDDPKVRFYAGAPLITPDGVGIGTICVLDDKPRNLSADQRSALETLSRHVMSLLELRRAARRLRESETVVPNLNDNLEQLVETRTAELRSSEDRFRQLAENSSEVCWFWETNPDRVVYVSPAVEEIWGLPSERFSEDPSLWLKSIHPDDLPRIAAGTERVISNELPRFQTEYRIVRPDGSIRWILYRGSTTCGADGRVLRVSGMAKDITERKEAAEALQFTVERMQLAAKAGRVGIWDFDPASERLAWDEEMFELYGLPRSDGELPIERWHKSLHPDDRETAIAYMEEVLKSGDKPFDLEFRIIRERDGATRYIRAVATVFRGSDGTPTRIIGTNWDGTDDRLRERELATALSQQKELTRAAQSGERAKSEFLAVMSHEIRTPLNGILGFASLLADGKELSAESRDHVATITGSGQALLRILNDVLDFSRIEAGQLGIEESDYSPANLISEIGHFFEHRAGSENLEFRTEAAPSTPVRVTGDPGRIRQVLINLTGNALKFTEQGSIGIGVRETSSADGALGLEYYVEDTGPGIPEERLPTIFEPFIQLDSSHTRRYGGTGLGLTISRKLAELMGGALEAENREDCGVRFSLRLPLKVVADSETPPPSESKLVSEQLPAPEDFGDILVVEDDKINLKLITNIIRKLGFEPLKACNGIEALEVYTTEHPTFILMDVQMPEMDGVAATLKIREFEAREGLRPAFIAALTANVMPENRLRCLDAGMNLYLTKPLRREAISEAMRSAIDFRK